MGQALCYYKKGKSYRLTLEEENARKDFISMFKEDNPWEDVIINYLLKEQTRKFTSADILYSKGMTNLEDLERRTRLSLSREISEAAKALGLSQCRLSKFGEQDRGWELKDSKKLSEFLAKYTEDTA